MKRLSSYLLFLLHIIVISINASPSELHGPISLIWQANREKAWEEDWLMELLNGVDVTIVDDGNYKKYIDNSIIVISAWQKSSDCKAYFQKLHKMKYKFGVILLSDERYIVPKDLYKYPAFVFRNYWNKNFIGQKNVAIFPLGYKKGFWQDGYPTIKPAAQRHLTWSFVGQITKKPTREAMITALKTFPNCFVYETFAWADPNSLDAISYRNILLDSLFVPCPAGWVNLDSFRVYEALECGCIPIVEKGSEDYFSRYFGEHPFITVDSWEQVPRHMNELLANPDLLEQRRIQCYEWWQAHKKMLNTHWIKTIQRSFN